MCASFAFAQTNTVSPMRQAEKIAMAAPKAAPVDYKASIFAKDGDTIVTWNFAADQMTGISYGSNAKVNASDVIDGEAVGSNAHTLTSNYTFWQRINDSASIHGDAFAAMYPSLQGTTFVTLFLAPRVSAVNVGDDNGFMLLSMWDQGRNRAGNYNSYVAFPAVTTPANAGVVDIVFLQAYYNYYDQCFIDYKVAGAWKSREINVDGVDCGINEVAAYRARYTMPLELADQANIEIRFRSFADGAGATFGYLWAIDNVSIVVYPDPTTRWNQFDETYVDGAYGTIPQGFNIPMTWTSSITNTGTTNMTNLNVNMTHLYFDDNGTLQTNQILSTPQGNLNAGDPINATTLVVNERGFWDEDHPGWFGHATTYGASHISGMGLHGLPTSHAGVNYVTTTAVSGSSAAEWDTILYRVSDATEEFDANSGMIEGYRWAHDNGLIPAGSQYAVMYTDDGYIASDVSDDQDHWSKANYGVTVRYTTGDVIPEGWVIRGVEMIPATTTDVISNAIGAQYTVNLYTLEYDETGDSYSGSTINTGVNNTIQEVTADQLNILESGYILPGQDYNAINILFPEQPELLPNTAYNIGYSLTRDGSFGVASTAWSYLHESGNYQAYYRDNNTAPFYNQFRTGGYDVSTYDANYPEGRTSGTIWSYYYNDAFPMIRLIVGPRMELPSTTVYAVCSDDTGYVIENVVGENVCGEAVSAVIGSSPTFYFIPSSDHMVVDSIYVDGHKVTPYSDDDATSDENCFTNEYNVVDGDNNVLLYRVYYGYMFDNIQTTHTIKAFTSYHEFNEVGIDPIAANVSLGLQPNPATSQVKLNIKGVDGMVNCNIIDMSGRVVYDANINAEEVHTIDLSNVPAGAYFVRVTNSNFSKVEKLIVR